jgi:hypothetical protein
LKIPRKNAEFGSIRKEKIRPEFGVRKFDTECRKSAELGSNQSNFADPAAKN